MAPPKIFKVMFSAGGKKSVANKKPLHRWKKGQSGNPFGQGLIPAVLRAAARQYTEEALETIVKAMREGVANGDYRLSLLAAGMLLDRGYGKPKETLELDTQTATSKKIDLSKLSASQLSQLKDTLQHVNVHVVDGELVPKKAIEGGNE